MPTRIIGNHAAIRKAVHGGNGPVARAYKAQVQELTDQGLSRQQAVIEIQRSLPQLHAEYLQEANAGFSSALSQSRADTGGPNKRPPNKGKKVGTNTKKDQEEADPDEPEDDDDEDDEAPAPKSGSKKKKTRNGDSGGEGDEGASATDEWNALVASLPKSNENQRLRAYDRLVAENPDLYQRFMDEANGN